MYFGKKFVKLLSENDVNIYDGYGEECHNFEYVSKIIDESGKIHVDGSKLYTDYTSFTWHFPSWYKGDEEHEKFKNHFYELCDKFHIPYKKE